MTNANLAKEIVPPSLLDIASPVSERVQIQNVYLLETRAKRGSIRGQLPSTLGFTVNVTTQMVESTITVRPLLTVTAKYDDADDAEEALRIEAIFFLKYQVSSVEGLTKENLDAFGATNGVYNVWPFWREYVQAMTARLGLPSLTIPVLPPANLKTARTVKPKAARVKPKRQSKRRTSLK